MSCATTSTMAASYFTRIGFVAISREEAPAPIRASLAFRKACPLAPQRCC